MDYKKNELEVKNNIENMQNMLSFWPTKNVAAAIIVEDETFLITPNDNKESINTIFEWASVTKLLTSYALLIAHEEGSINLNDKVDLLKLGNYKILGDIKYTHLLSHSSGLPFEGKEAFSKPEVKRIYSNNGFDLLAQYFKLETNFTLTDYIKEAVFDQLGMTSFSFFGEMSVARDSKGTVSDMGKFVKELISPTLVSQETLDWATQNWFEDLRGILPGFGRYDDNAWGLGFEIKSSKKPHWMPDESSPKTFGHFGKSGSFLWVDPTTSIGIACCCDVDFDVWAHQLWPTFSGLIL